MRPISARVWVCLLGTLGVVSGCDQRDPAKCEQGMKVTRDAVARADFAVAQQWREYSWKQCADRSALEGLDREIVAKRSAIEAETRVTEERRRGNRELLKVFLTWVAENRAAADRASASPVCDPPAANDPKKEESKQRLCTASRTAGTFALTARYWAEDPKLARFSVKLPDVTSCEEIGADKASKTWAVAASGGRTTPRHRCDFSTGPLTGMVAVLSEAVNADLYVFDPGYLDKEPGYKLILEGP